MSIFPLAPRFKLYRGGKDNLRRQAAETNAARQRIAEHVNHMVANNPAEIQVIGFSSVARDLGVSTDEVRNAIGNGGYNGITFGVRGPEREALARYKRPGPQGEEA